MQIIKQKNDLDNAGNNKLTMSDLGNTHFANEFILKQVLESYLISFPLSQKPEAYYILIRKG